jgi:RNA-dependent RNA polymerase
LHLRIADLKGLDCDECVQLAEKASHAVDFPKTGTPVDFRSLPRPSGQEKPDFLASEAADTSDDKRFYPSDKVLGILFRSVPTEKPTDPLDPGINPSDTDTIDSALSKIDFGLLGLPPLVDPPDEVWQEMEGLLYSYYTDKLTSIAQTHAFSKHRGATLLEEELVSGTIMAKWADHRKRREAVAAMNLQAGRSS